MTKTAWSVIAGGLVIFGLGLVAGRLSAPALPDRGSLTDSSSAKIRSAPRDVGRAERSAGSPHSSRGHGGMAVSDQVVVSRSLLAEFSESFQRRTLKHSLFDKGDVIVKHLEITPQEQAQVEAVWREVKEEIRSLEASRCEVTIPGDGPAEIVVPDLSGELSGVTQGMRDGLETILGDDRASVFASVKQLEGVLKRSQSERTISISFEPITGDRWRYRISSDSESGKRTWVTEGVMPDEIRHLTDASNIAPSPNDD